MVLPGHWVLYNRILFYLSRREMHEEEPWRGSVRLKLRVDATAEHEHALNTEHTPCSMHASIFELAREKDTQSYVTRIHTYALLARYDKVRVDLR